MGFKLNLILGSLLIVSIAGSAMYINMQKATIEKLQIELQTAINNQAVLENTISSQNNQITEQLEQQKISQERITQLNEDSKLAQAEVNKLRNTFARHDLNNLAIAKPGLIEKIVNKGTVKVNKELVELTNPRQFDEENIPN
ncbi:hypothetical protein N9P69_00960 [Gammaproteobacteria bacterium]|jgi:hypothetical protein|nr:hypothetical protein [Gammaproteobacteria bacterium]|tara:strand:- start:659 stop:1084 length:426 start_codon:yes stop_codon:yes gene_type:complete